MAANAQHTTDGAKGNGAIWRWYVHRQVADAVEAALCAGGKTQQISTYFLASSRVEGGSRSWLAGEHDPAEEVDITVRGFYRDVMAALDACFERKADPSDHFLDIPGHPVHEVRVHHEWTYRNHTIRLRNPNAGRVIYHHHFDIPVPRRDDVPGVRPGDHTVYVIKNPPPIRSYTDRGGYTCTQALKTVVCRREDIASVRGDTRPSPGAAAR